MKVFLKENVKNVGKTGDLVQVKPGFARNFLLPKNLAFLATSRKLKEWTHLQKVAEIKRKKNENHLKTALETLSKTKLKFQRATTTSGDRLFGSVSSVDISKALQEMSFEVNRQDVKSEPIKTLGEHKITISFGEDMDCEILVKVEKTKEQIEQEKSEPKRVPRKKAAKSQEDEDHQGDEDHQEDKNSPKEPSAEEVSSEETDTSNE